MANMGNEKDIKARLPEGVLRAAWRLNMAMLGCVFAAAMLVDGNGRLPGMSRPFSLILTLALFALGMISALAVLVFWPKPTGKVAGGFALVAYVVLAIPAVL